MPILLAILGLAALGALAYGASEAHASEGKKDGAFDRLPEPVVGQPTRFEETGNSGSQYLVDQYPPNEDDIVFVVVQLKELVGPVDVAPYDAWIRFWKERETGNKSISGMGTNLPDKLSSDAVLQIMLQDWGFS